MDKKALVLLRIPISHTHNLFVVLDGCGSLLRAQEFVAQKILGLLSALEELLKI